MVQLSCLDGSHLPFPLYDIDGHGSIYIPVAMLTALASPPPLSSSRAYRSVWLLRPSKELRVKGKECQGLYSKNAKADYASALPAFGRVTTQVFALLAPFASSSTPTSCQK